MKVIFLSNYFNHHQQPFSDAMYKRLSRDYIFLAAAEVEEERIKMGWQATGFPPYVRQMSYKNASEVEQWSKIIADADIVIGLAFYYKLLLRRMKSGKTTFLYSERLYKTNSRFLKAPIHAYRAFLLRNCYMLCSSAYTSFDYALTGCYKDKCFKWGYFPALKKYDEIESIVNSKGFGEGLKHQKVVSILWVARLIGWKHPELPVKLGRFLKEKGYKFSVNIIGNGPLEPQVKALIEKNGLTEHVKLLGSMTPNEVREHMENSNIFLFTSDRNEGWGAVLNESMNSGCAVVVNQKIGSVPYLLKDGENGFSYSTEHEFYEKVERLIREPQLRKNFGLNAYKTMLDTWNADTACENFFKLVEDIRVGRNTSIQEGPCSVAEIINGL